MLPSTPHRVFDPIAETEQRKQLNVYFRWSTMHENILHPDALLRRYTSVSEKHYGQEKQVQIKKNGKAEPPFSSASSHFTHGRYSHFPEHKCKTEDSGTQTNKTPKRSGLVLTVFPTEGL